MSATRGMLIQISGAACYHLSSRPLHICIQVMQNQMLQLGKYFIRELEFQYSKTVLSLSPYTKVCENGDNHMKSFKQKYLIFVILLRIPPQYKTRAILMNNFQHLYSHFLKEEFQVLKLRKPSLHQFVGLYIASYSQLI
ncbi:unnamed protein product (macronuclear) [Paramecium tetraurelia]|uniref:Trafficking protein particle complex subunit n=1 Tax=Paramecium tetraurelia TaxID=5888 RepID=A0C1V4_PARTE|nr:uncharacterized protein GSPATT00034248001 [Paramecium tetraurelia]CAK64771.1 unnamed protein product [Paramecium tetraurelia]|eukprot:XP_001432168.1 hypothetical protein (macronuclear) [Paramecium tetraurelia strain d4-2]